MSKPLQITAEQIEWLRTNRVKLTLGFEYDGQMFVRLSGYPENYGKRISIFDFADKLDQAIANFEGFAVADKEPTP